MKLIFVVLCFMALARAQRQIETTQPTEKERLEKQNIVHNFNASDRSKLTPLERSMLPFYRLTNSFLDVVQPDRQRLNESGILIGKLIDEPVKYMSESYGHIVEYYPGYTACIVFGVVYMLALPLSGLLFCICRCCGKCGGDKRDTDKMDPPNARAYRLTLNFILAVFVTLILGGATASFISANLVHTQLTTDAGGLTSNVYSSFSAFDQYLENSLDETENLLKKDVPALATSILKSVNTTHREALDYVGREEHSKATKVMEGFTNLVKRVKDVAVSLKNVEKWKANLQDQLVDGGNNTVGLTRRLQALRRQLISILINCNSFEGAVKFDCQSIPKDALADFTATVNIKNIPDFSDAAKMVAGFSRNLSIQEANAKQSYNDIVQPVQREVNQLTNSVKAKLDQVKGTSDSFVIDLRLKLRKLNLMKTAENFITVMDANEKYFDYVFIGMVMTSAVVLVIVFLLYLGLVYGICGSRAGNQQDCCNRGCGANVLVTAVIVTFLCSALVMAACTAVFATGGPMQTEFCRNLKDPSSPSLSSLQPLLDRAITKSNLDFQFDLQLALMKCRDNEPILQVIQYKKLFGLQVEEKFQKLQDELIIWKMKKYSIGSTPKVLTPESRDMLKSVMLELDVKLNQNNIQKAIVELEKPIVGVDLQQFETKLASFRNKVTMDDEKKQQDIREGLRQVINELRAIRRDTMKKINGTRDFTLNQLRTLLTKSKGYRNDLDDLLKQADRAQEFIEAEGSRLVSQFVPQFLNTTLHNGKEEALRIERTLQTEVGRCEPAYKSYQFLLNAGCTKILDPFNQFWFSLGACLAFMIPCIIIALYLAHLYSRETLYDPIYDTSNPYYDPPEYRDAIPLD